MSLILAAVLLAQGTTLATAADLRITGVRAPVESLQHTVVEVSIDTTGGWKNPYDSSEVSLDAQVQRPSGQTTRVPGFFSEPYTRELAEGKEVLRRSGSGSWKLRVYAAEVGKYEVQLTLRAGSKVALGQSSFSVGAAQGKTSGKGFIRVDGQDHRYFVFDDSTPFYPVGTNLCWAGEKGTFEFDGWLSNLEEQKCNWARLWLSPAWTTLGLEKAGKASEGKGLGYFDQESAWKLDHIVNQASKQGLYLQFCLDSYNILRDGDAYPYWAQTPHNRENGGPLRIWSDFWTDATMQALYRNKLRYLVARYGAYPQVMAWEFWNEVDLTGDFDVPVVRDWHRRMSQTLRELDPYKHLVTTSTSNSMGVRELELIPEIDFVQTHHYNSPDLAATVAYQQSRKSGWGKAHFFGEIGADSAGPRSVEDPQGNQIHDPIWASIATGSSGTAMVWWWDSLVAPNKLWPLFGAAQRFVADIDWPREGFRQVDLGFAYQSPPKTPRRSDLVWENGPTPWAPGPGARAQKVLVTNGSVSGDVPASIQHGLRNHPDLHNPLTFVIDSPRPLKFDVIVGDVSGYGGARLQIRLNGIIQADKNFSDPDDNRETTTLTKYAGRYSINVPAGKNKVVIENLGNDWFMASYRLVDAVRKQTPPVQGWGISGENTAVAWVRVEGRSWRNVASLKQIPPAAPPTVVGFPGLAAGTWSVELYDTWAGKSLQTSTLKVGTDGKARVRLPILEKDLAIKLRRRQ